MRSRYWLTVNLCLYIDLLIKSSAYFSSFFSVRAMGTINTRYFEWFLVLLFSGSKCHLSFCFQSKFFLFSFLFLPLILAYPIKIYDRSCSWHVKSKMWIATIKIFSFPLISRFLIILHVVNVDYLLHWLFFSTVKNSMEILVFFDLKSSSKFDKTISTGRIKSLDGAHLNNQYKRIWKQFCFYLFRKLIQSNKIIRFSK